MSITRCTFTLHAIPKSYGSYRGIMYPGDAGRSLRRITAYDNHMRPRLFTFYSMHFQIPTTSYIGTCLCTPLHFVL